MDAGRDQDDLVQLQRFTHFLGHDQVREVGRVERPPEDPLGHPPGAQLPLVGTVAWISEAERVERHCSGNSPWTSRAACESG